ncbi:hypothetical protein Mgra_00001973 [Meloidogyne graminicola]|uniref:EF-hand domain-containing protein n=1 Tax=Meloidogyne graminicola TaxID=189291 RepID=A0A8S9ZZP0_9BILA|nr:hypothetical protein Mgra_00001973 [Meloidogyne graminicola]
MDFAHSHYGSRPFIKSAFRVMIPYYTIPCLIMVILLTVDFNWFLNNGRILFNKYFKSEAAVEEQDKTNDSDSTKSSTPLPFDDDDELFIADNEKNDKCSIVGKKKKKKIGFRERRIIHYEDRIRAYSSPDKIFRYFATIKIINEDGSFDIFMTPEDFVRSLTPGVIQPRKYGLDKYKVINSIENLEGKGFNSKNIFNWLSDNGGLINFGDYLFLMTLLSTSPSEFKLAFYVFDLNGDGELDRQEFERVQELILSQSNIGQRHRDHITGTGTFTKSGKNSAITRYFFGSDNLQKLNINKFLQFQKDLHYDILKIEFERRDPESGPVGIISEVSFAQLLMIHSDLPEKRQKRMINRVKRKYKEIVNKKGVSFEEVNNFFSFIYHIDSVDLALHFYKLVGKPLSKELIKRLAHKITNVELSDIVVDIVVTLFDENGDGELSQREFVSIMKQRKQRGLERPKDTGLTRLLDALWICTKNQLNISTTSLNNEEDKIKEKQNIFIINKWKRII